MEGVGEGTDDKGVVKSEWALDKVETDAAGVDNDIMGDLSAVRVDHGGGQSSRDKGEDVAGGTESSARFTVALWSAAVQKSEIELFSGV